jgi:hypothetical protein
MHESDADGTLAVSRSAPPDNGSHPGCVDRRPGPMPFAAAESSRRLTSLAPAPIMYDVIHLPTEAP